jgi:hypothetical protein
MVSFVQTLPEGRTGQGLDIMELRRFGTQAIAPAISLGIMERYGTNITINTTAIILFVSVFVVLFMPRQEKLNKRPKRISVNYFIAKEVFGPSDACVHLLF